MYEAIETYTKNSAITTGTDQFRGQLKTGYQADLTVLRDNPLRGSIDKIADIPIVMTMVDGQIVYNNLSS